MRRLPSPRVLSNGAARRLQRRRGFTLVELIVALVVFAVAVIGLSTAINLIRKQTTQTRLRAQAAALGLGIIEQVRTIHYDSIPTSFGPTSLVAQGGTFSVSGSSVDSASIMRTFQVRISYPSQYGGTKIDTFTTRVAK